MVCDDDRKHRFVTFRRPHEDNDLIGAMHRSSARTPALRHDPKRLYREVIDISKVLESAFSLATSLKDVFTDSAVRSRDRLKELCETIILSSPVDYGRRAEDLLWKRCYHDLTQFYKQNKMKMTSQEIKLLQVHLVTGFGLYYGLLAGVAKQYSISLQKLMPYISSDLAIDEFSRDQPNHSQEVKAWAQSAVHRVLVYMGDLARYLFDLNVTGYKELAIRFYDLALIWDPEVGMPFNQLGTLSESNNFGLDSAYYYMRCLTCERPFEGALNNLKRVFDANEKRLLDFETQNNSEESFKCVRQSIFYFLKFCREYWLRKSSDNNQNKTVLAILQETLHSLNDAFKLQPKLTTEQNPTFMTPTITFEMAVITVMIVDRIEETDINQSPSNTNQALSMVLTFALNYLITAMTSCHQTLKNKLGLEPNSFKPNGISSPKLSKENTPDLSPRRALSRLRRRKAAINYDDNNALSLDDDDSELSELEETALSTIDALEIGSDLSDSGEESDSDNLDVTIISSEEDNSLLNKTIEVKPIESSAVPADDVINYIANDSYLPTIKMFCDWLRSNPNILSLISSHLQLCVQEMIAFVNTLLNIEMKVLQSFPALSEFKCSGLEWTQKYPLPSDLSLSNIKCLKSWFRTISFNSQRSLTNREKGFLYLESIIAFLHYLKECPNLHGIAYDYNDKRFTYNNHFNGIHFNHFPTNTWSENNSIFVSSNNSMNNIENENSFDESKKQKKFMRNMAHLWLKAEVKELEKDVSFAPQLPPYMVLDSSTYIEDLAFVKELALSKRFIIVVPKIVLASLDHQKKVSASAREAIRWLEEELQRGNRMIKYPKDTEKLSLSPMKYPKRKDKEAFDYYELLECCNYLNKNTKTERKMVCGMPIVSLLTNSLDKWPPNAEAVAKTSGIHVETVESFLTKWQKRANT